ncbi:hypothetical protein [Shewanella sp. YLB-07]|uniref:hypothetical protein n=1 Tax=Shewanella sp. YLB-07 TaxID=2601268 RepID=UPI00128E763D|nr:hypothetical protein [Shewanella sp. YLB-07]MPY24562.1 hypothetical protein [Shewanella sp. YLB-07]
MNMVEYESGQNGSKSFIFENTWGDGSVHQVLVNFSSAGNASFIICGVHYDCNASDIKIMIDQSTGDPDFENAWFSISTNNFSTRVSFDTYLALVVFPEFSCTEVIKPHCEHCDSLIEHPYDSIVRDHDEMIFCSELCVQQFNDET